LLPPDAPPPPSGLNNRLQEKTSAIEVLAVAHASWQLLVESMGDDLRPTRWPPCTVHPDITTFTASWEDQMRRWDRSGKEAWLQRAARG